MVRNSCFGVLILCAAACATQGQRELSDEETRDRFREYVDSGSAYEAAKLLPTVRAIARDVSEAGVASSAAAFVVVQADDATVMRVLRDPEIERDFKLEVIGGMHKEAISELEDEQR